MAEFANSVDLDEVAHNDYTVCPLVSEVSMWYTLHFTFFENLSTKILSSALW